MRWRGGASKRDDTAAIATIAEHLNPVTGEARDWDALVEQLAPAKVVCIGEASHGTHEFYQVRADLSRRLIAEHGFDAVVAEADWPDSFCVDRFVRGVGQDSSAVSALRGFRRFPQWMWRNTVMVDFVEWLWNHDRGKEEREQAHFFGMDLYSLHASVDAVLRYLERVDPEGAKRARFRYSCFDHFGEDPQAYGYAASFDLSRSCEDVAVRQLVELQRRMRDRPGGDEAAATEWFSAEQNARLVKNAEEYYRSMFRGRVSSWNLRDRHMVETLVMIAEHLEAQGREGKLIVWAHNSHLGDARATQMGRGGEWNVGQLVREHWGRERCALVGFTTHAGTVSAADDWDEPVQRKAVRPSLPGSWERLLHDVADSSGSDSFWLPTARPALRDLLRETRLERAIGVIYRPETERMSHYFDAEIGEQFDAVIHLDETRALTPLERNPSWEGGEVPETYPSGI